MGTEIYLEKMKITLLSLLVILSALALTNQIYLKINLSEEACLQAYLMKNDEVLTKIKILNMPEKGFKTKKPLLSLLYISEQSRILSKPVEITKQEQTNLFVHSQGGYIKVCVSTPIDYSFKVEIKVDHTVPSLGELPTKKEGEELNVFLYGTVTKARNILALQSEVGAKEKETYELNVQFNDNAFKAIVFEIVVVFLTGVFQFISLKSFFEKQNLL